MTKVFLCIGLLLACPIWAKAQTSSYAVHQVKALQGDGVLSLLRRYDLQAYPCNLNAFYELNKLDKSAQLLTGRLYKLPVKLYTYNSESIRSTIGITDYNKALAIAKYNLALKDKGVRSTSYQTSKILWVPFHFTDCASTTESIVELIAEDTGPVKEYNTDPLLGPKHAKYEILDRSLKGQVYYITSGHGGPDPGAQARKSGTDLCEDEYAYDVALRLYRKLKSHGATAYMIIQDPDDGIRSDRILTGDQDELCLGKAKIPLSQRIRLDQRTQAVNHLYKKHRREGVKQQTAIFIHVDSRSEAKQQDVFFYYYDKSKAGKQLADTMLETFRQKYKVNRRSGQYSGTVSSRNLYVIKNTYPKAVFVELANIRNTHDQKRILYPENRQALAEWLYLGLIKDQTKS